MPGFIIIREMGRMRDYYHAEDAEWFATFTGRGGAKVFAHERDARKTAVALARAIPVSMATNVFPSVPFKYRVVKSDA